MNFSGYSSGRRPVSTLSLVLPAILSAVMMGLSGLFAVFPLPVDNFGFCLPSPNLWDLPRTAGWALNTFLLLLCAAAWLFLNKEFTIVKGIDHLTLVSFLVFVSSNPVCTGHLSTGSILLCVTVLCLGILFGTVNRRNCTHQIFVIFTFLSIGSMFQYAFVAMMIFFFLAAIILKAMRTKEVLAMLLGIIAPYWVVIGLGIVSVKEFTLPEFVPDFASLFGSTRMIVLWINFGFSLLMGILMAISNSMAIFAGNTVTRRRNNVITLTIILTALFVIFNYSNMAAYLPAFYFALAVQVGNFFAYHTLSWRKTIVWSFTALYVTGMVLMITL